MVRRHGVMRAWWNRFGGYKWVGIIECQIKGCGWNAMFQQLDTLVGTMRAMKKKENKNGLKMEFGGVEEKQEEPETASP